MHDSNAVRNNFSSLPPGLYDLFDGRASLHDFLPDLTSPFKTVGSMAVSWVMRGGGLATAHKQLVIAVASSLQDVDRRNAIRKTWKTLANPEDAKLYFVMAEHPCPLDPYWRLRDTGCEPWKVTIRLVTNTMGYRRRWLLTKFYYAPFNGRSKLLLTPSLCASTCFLS